MHLDADEIANGGAVSTVYLEEGKNQVRLHHDGCRDEDLEVAIGPDFINGSTTVLVPTP